MPRSVSPGSDIDEVHDSILVEEYERLQNQYRVLKNDRDAYVQESQYQLSKYKKEKDFLEKDNEELLTVLNLADSGVNKKNEIKVINELKEKVMDFEDCNQKIEDERQTLSSLDAEILKYTRLVAMIDKDWRKTSGMKSKVDSSEARHIVKTKIMNIENKLNKKINAFCTILTKNGELRDEINKLRNERAIYSGVQKNLNDRFQSLRRQIDSLTGEATQAHELRDDANNKCVMLKDKNDKDQNQFEIEIRDLQRKIDHNQRLKLFMNSKMNERMEFKKMEEERRRKHGSSGEVAVENQRKKIITFEDAIQRIEEITGETKLDKILQTFLRKEEENFSFFQYVNELNDQVENLRDSIDKIHQQRGEYEQKDQDIETERKKMIKRYEREMNEDKAVADKAAGQLSQVAKMLDQVKDGTHNLVDKADCEVSIITKMLGATGDDSVTERNLMLYLGLVEQRINELLSVLYHQQTKRYAAEEGQPPPDHGMLLGLANMKKQQKDFNVLVPNI
ncbi:Coiled-coil domain-containing protein 63, partial [Cichlidogyrus casuarinus]